MSSKPTVTPPTTRTDRQILALQRQAGKYPKVKQIIKKIKEKRRVNDWLSQ